MRIAWTVSTLLAASLFLVVPIAHSATGFLSVFPSNILRLDTNSLTLSPFASVPPTPPELALDQTGTRLYVLQYYAGAGSLVRLNAITGASDSTFALPDAPASFVLAPDGKHAFVTINSRNSVMVINTQTGTSHEIVLPNPTGSLAINRTGTRLYVVTAPFPSYSNPGTIVVLDVATEAIAAYIPVPLNAASIIVNTSGTRVFVSHSSTGGISVIDSATNTVIDSLPGVGSLMTLSPDETKIYLTFGLGSTLSVIDIPNHNISATITFPESPNTGPTRTVVDQATNKLYVPQFFANYVAVIDATTNQIVSKIGTSGSASDLVLVPSLTQQQSVAVPALNNSGLIALVSLMLGLGMLRVAQGRERARS